MIIGLKRKRLSKHFQSPMHCDLDLRTPKSKGHIFDSWGVCMTFHDYRCKGNTVTHQKPFSEVTALWPWPFDPKINRAHPWLIAGLCVKFHDYRCKGIALLQHKPFSIINALWPWPLDPEIKRAYPWLMESLCVKFHNNRCKGKAIMQHKPFQ